MKKISITAIILGAIALLSVIVPMIIGIILVVSKPTSIGVIGGADDPTAILIAGSASIWSIIIVLTIGILLLAIGICSLIKLKQ